MIYMIAPVFRSACLSIYRQIGNAIAPPVAAVLGRCIALAAAGAVPPGAKVVGHEVRMRQAGHVSKLMLDGSVRYLL
jgi:hypothetical protein